MAQTKHEIQGLLAEAGMSPRHRFGQNFMIDQNLVRVVAEAGEVGKEDWVIEVGPGTGTLTEELLARAGRVVAVEIDRDLAGVLRERFGGRPGFELIEGDALAGKHQLNGEILKVIGEGREQGHCVKLVANLPYNIASPLIVEMLIGGVDLLAFTVQREVAGRLAAKAGGEAYGVLTVMAQMLAEVEVLRTLPPQAFWPAPKIESALVRMRRRDRLGEKAGAFGEFVRRVFSSRRKMLRKALVNGGYEAQRVLEGAGLSGEIRPEEVEVEGWWRMFEAAGGVNDEGGLD